MAKIYREEYKGKTILFEDYQNASPDEIVDLFIKANRLTFNADPGSNILIFANFEGAMINGEIMDYLKNNEAKKAAKIIKKSAIIGMNESIKLMMDFYTHFTKGNVESFQTAQEALDWLVRE